mmetsp:Transcript_42139/g.63640  ORF Transcript_42139/g.63640 Transcript_42139/m.63640 type:complete len:462 (+) Transcript_42139:15-1400(+)
MKDDNQENDDTKQKQHDDAIIHIATLTNQELLIQVLITIQSIGNEAKQWLLTTPNGQHAYLHIGQRAAEGELLPLEWSCVFQRMMASSIHDTDANNEIKNVISTSELLRTTMEKLPPNSHRKRMWTALQIITKQKVSPLTIQQGAAFVKASLEEENRDYQSQILTLFTGTLPKNCNVVMAALASLQLPILRQMDHAVMEDILQCSQLDYRIANLFHHHICEKKEQFSSLGDDCSTENSKALKIIRFVQAANLARRGNQIGSKHGALLCVSRQVIDKHEELSKLVKRHSYNTDYYSSNDDDKAPPTKYDIVIGQGWNHNVLVNPKAKGGKKRMIHSEVHAVTSTIQQFGEELAFRYLFPNAVVIIVELVGDVTYDNAPPCPKCDTLLRAVGVGSACHSTKRGIVVEDLQLGNSNVEFLNRETVRIPFRAACNELGVECLRLKEAEERIHNLDAVNIGARKVI